MSSKEIVDWFEIGHDTLTRWLRQYRQIGHLIPKKRGRYSGSRLNEGQNDAEIF